MGMPQENGNQSTARQHQPLIISRYNLLLEKLLIGETIDNLLLELACLIQEKQPDCISAVMTCSDDGKSMRCAAGPQLPTGLRKKSGPMVTTGNQNDRRSTITSLKN